MNFEVKGHLLKSRNVYQSKHQNNIFIASSFLMPSSLLDVIKVALIEAVHYLKNCIISLIAIDCFVLLKSSKAVICYEIRITVDVCLYCK